MQKLILASLCVAAVLSQYTNQGYQYSPQGYGNQNGQPGTANMMDQGYNNGNTNNGMNNIGQYPSYYNNGYRDFSHENSRDRDDSREDYWRRMNQQNGNNGNYGNYGPQVMPLNNNNGRK